MKIKLTYIVAAISCTFIWTCESADKESSDQPADNIVEHQWEETEQKNKAVVESFFEEYFNQKDLSAADRHFGEVYIQHNPNAKDGKEALNKGFGAYLKETPSYQVSFKRFAADKDLVWVHSHSTSDADSLGEACVDIFRLEDFKIVEHWDVCQPVPASSQNDNTMF